MRSPSKKFKNIHTLDRIRLISDALFFMVEGELDWKIVLYLMDYLSMEDDVVVWQSETVKLLLYELNLSFHLTKYRQHFEV